ncbi:MAG: hypothetical protein HY738_11285 [Bacteroidia bacterium]|nr:hypothetical protein [Bacteroidia bacterium]
MTHTVLDFFKSKFCDLKLFTSANDLLFEKTGIINFFNTQYEFDKLKAIANENINIVEEPDRSEYGDFQTNFDLANNIVKFINSENFQSSIAIEPTCGKGNFILALIKNNIPLKKIYGIEIYKPYIWECKFSILNFFHTTAINAVTEIEFIHLNVFNFDFSSIAEKHLAEKILIIGNPPWVTNSKLSILNSSNLPEKTNFKKHNGFDAITGKGNFDIGEYISLMMLDAFQNHYGLMVFLLKNSVIKNILFDQKIRQYKISKIEQYNIDSKKEFNVSVDASLFCCKLNSKPELFCNEFDFYNNSKQFNSFGWFHEKFVSDISRYELSQNIDGKCQFEWRQGVKHDCSNIMELEKLDNHFVNGINQNVSIENDLIYGILKSSDLKSNVINKSRKYTIITQQRIGQDTSYIRLKFPKTFNYLEENKSTFELRKSSIYKDKPAYSIFGIGDYSFKPFKVAISGLYKNYSFNLILPQESKPLMLDDTCYFLSFDNIEFAVYSYILLNTNISKEFLKSVTFTDAKRIFTKDVLMRIDLFKISKLLNISYIEEEIDKLFLNISTSKWNTFISIISNKSIVQTNIFETINVTNP